MPLMKDGNTNKQVRCNIKTRFTQTIFYFITQHTKVSQSCNKVMP